ncbi:PdaC/SigV domain-containing protein [Paenibacillus guangzhouensis]|uniref:PdaC/SigV domain-containing protein n=1 Tax=Paenibacillus guangzhouensis TaxID=1473112 RepID=UPI00187B5237|nr:DUF4163 domain-containing protein [Paenibacillus guangzhouensis]
MKNVLRTITLVALCLVFLNQTSHASAAASVQSVVTPNIQITLDGAPLLSKGIVHDGSTYIPLNILTKDLKLDGAYDAKKKVMHVKAKGKDVVIQVGQYAVNSVVNGHELWDAYGRVLVNGNNYVALSLLTDNFGYQSVWDSKTKSVHLVKIQENDMIWSSKKIDENTKDAIINVQYPQVSGLKNAEVQEKINTLFAAEAKKYVDTAKENSKGAYEELGFKYEYTSNYDIKYNSNQVISLLFSSNEYTGGAHGMPEQWSYTINIDTGTVYTLDDLFKLVPDYKQVINEKIKKDIAPMLMYDAKFQSINEDTAFYVKDEGVVIYFGVYEYTPYAAGFPEFYIPFRSISSTLDGKLPF